MELVNHADAPHLMRLAAMREQEAAPTGVYRPRPCLPHKAGKNAATSKAL